MDNPRLRPLCAYLKYMPCDYNEVESSSGADTFNRAAAYDPDTRRYTPNSVVYTAQHDDKVEHSALRYTTAISATTHP